MSPGPTVGSCRALWPQLQALLLLGASAESQTLSSRPIWPTFGPPQLGRDGERLPGLSLTPLGGRRSSHAAERGARARCSAAPLGLTRTATSGIGGCGTPRLEPSRSHTTDCGSRLNQGPERNVLIEIAGLSTAGGCLLILQRLLLWEAY